MYVIPYSRNTNESEIFEFIHQNGFGILVSQVDNKPWATHIPMILSEDGKKLTSHISRANKQWKHWNENPEVLAIFQGAHTYISSSWYDHENVPTWNYLAVHVYGTLRIIEGDELLTSLKQLVDKYEKKSEHPLTVEGMSKNYLKQEMQGIVGFEITVSKIESAYKLSQNRDDKNFKEIIRQLEKRDDVDSHRVAEGMLKVRPGLATK